MKGLLLISMAGALAVATAGIGAAQPAPAPQAPAAADQPATPPLGQGAGPGFDPAAAARRQATAAFDRMVAAVNNRAMELDELAALNNVAAANVTVTDAATLLGGGSAGALNTALGAAPTADLAGAIAARPVLMTALGTTDPASVIAIDVNGAQVTVYYYTAATADQHYIVDRPLGGATPNGGAPAGGG